MNESLKQTLSTVSFKEAAIETLGETPQFRPRNQDQVTYFQRKAREIKRFGADPILAIHEVAISLERFVWSIATFPELVVSCGMPQLIEKALSAVGSDTLLMSYDTTFNLGDFYLSALVMKLEVFQEKPTIPIAFLIHTRKYQKMHESFFSNLSENGFSQMRVLL